MIKIVILLIILYSLFFIINTSIMKSTKSKLWKSVSVRTTAKPLDVWNIYSQFNWQDWDHDIKSMEKLDVSIGLVNNAKLIINMKDGKSHIATLSDVNENLCFTYTAPLPGSTLIAIHTLETLDNGETLITHSFDFLGYIGKVFKWLTKDYVQHGLEINTAEIKKMAEAASLNSNLNNCSNKDINDIKSNLLQNRVLIISFANNDTTQTKKIKLTKEDKLITVKDFYTYISNLYKDLSFKLEFLINNTNNIAKSYQNYDDNINFDINFNKGFLHILIVINEDNNSNNILRIDGRAFNIINGLIMHIKDPNNNDSKIEALIQINEQAKAELGTGLITWDGAVVLAKYLEKNNIIKDKNVLELGAGTGVVGIACSMLGAQNTILSDLEYTIDNLKANVDCNRIHINKNVNINVEILDWFDENTYTFSNNNYEWDVIVAADVVWLDHLVPPLVHALSILATNNTTILISHQKRAESTHNLLFTLLKQKFVVIEIAENEYHPSFISPKIKLYKCNKII